MFRSTCFVLLLVIFSVHSAPVCDDHVLAAISKTVVDALVNQTHLIKDSAYFRYDVTGAGGRFRTTFADKTDINMTVKDFGQIINEALAAGVTKDQLKSLQLNLLIQDLQKLDKNHSLFGEFIDQLQEIEHQIEHAPSVTLDCAHKLVRTTNVLSFASYKMCTNLWIFSTDLGIDYSYPTLNPIARELTFMHKFITLVVDLNQHLLGLKLNYEDILNLVFSRDSLIETASTFDDMIARRHSPKLEPLILAVTKSIEILDKVIEV